MVLTPLRAYFETLLAHIGRGGTDKSKVGDYENRLRYVKFGGLAI